MLKVFMKFTAGLVFWLLVSAGTMIKAQVVQPEAPGLYSVSIDPETGYVIIKWYPSPSSDVDYYRILEWLPDIKVGTPVGGPVYDTIVSLTYDQPHFQSVAFIVVGVDDLGGGNTTDGDWSQIDSTIYLHATYDTCLSVVSLVWNDYNSWRGSIAEYNIYRYMAPGMYELLATVPEGTNTLDLTNILPNQNYDLFVEAVNEDGRRSTSNRNAVETRMSEVPVSINADYATLSPGNNIDLSFTIVDATGNTQYNLLRSNSFDGTYALINTFNTSETNIQYRDEIPFTSNVQFYRMEVINDCGIAAVQSNRANNVILNASFVNLVASLEWNEYRDWSGGVEAYRVIRTIGRNNPVTDTIYTGNTSFYNDDFSGLVNYVNPEEGVICYRIEATENRNQFGIQGHSLSNQVCYAINPEIRVPNAFIPNDADPVNQTFEPVFSFLPEHYQMIIYNRLGLKIWEGSEPWDGRVNGKFVSEGVYLYYIRVFSYSSEITELNGKITVLYR